MRRYSLSSNLLLLSALWLGAAYSPAARSDALWESGRNQYIKLAEQDDSVPDAPPNAHPAQLDAQQIRLALEQLRFREDRLFSEEKILPVFSPVQRRTLARWVADGLAQARPDQELVFALAGRSSGLDSGLSFSGSLFTAGRIFHLDDRLHLIFGDFRRPRDKGQEAMAGQFGEYEISYRFKHGQRSGPSGVHAMKQPLLEAPGVENQRVDDQERLDWLVIDLPSAAEAVLEEQRQQEQNTPQAKAMDQATQERLEMRAELARMRKKLQDLSGAQDEPRRPDASSGIRQRISTLEGLRRDGLLTEEEYQRKRSEILDDL